MRKTRFVTGKSVTSRYSLVRCGSSDHLVRDTNLFNQLHLYNAFLLFELLLLLLFLLRLLLLLMMMVRLMHLISWNGSEQIPGNVIWIQAMPLAFLSVFAKS
jgi:hypothetical protein